MPSLLGLSREEIDARFADIAAFADIGEFIEQPVKSYSSGMYVRLAFAVIAHVDADILVIDEALSVGDAFFTQKCMRFLRNFMQKGTVLFVSHDTAAVINLCQKAVWLDKGQSAFQGTPKEAAEKYLAATYEAQQGESNTKGISANKMPEMLVNRQRDMRQDYINATPFRNDIELFSFNLDATSFGKGGGNITSVQLLDVSGSALAWVVGGENVRLKVRCHAHVDLFSPIVGFYCKDRLGQTLFGDNTLNFSPTPPWPLFRVKISKPSLNFRCPSSLWAIIVFSLHLRKGRNRNTFSTNGSMMPFSSNPIAAALLPDSWECQCIP